MLETQQPSWALSQVLHTAVCSANMKVTKIERLWARRAHISAATQGPATCMVCTCVLSKLCHQACLCTWADCVALAADAHQRNNRNVGEQVELRGVVRRPDRERPWPHARRGVGRPQVPQAQDAEGVDVVLRRRRVALRTPLRQADCGDLCEACRLVLCAHCGANVAVQLSRHLRWRWRTVLRFGQRSVCGPAQGIACRVRSLMRQARRTSSPPSLLSAKAATG